MSRVEWARTEFAIQPIDRFARPGAVIKRPTEITAFSYDSQHVLYHDTRSLKYYYTPEIGASLSEGFESFRKIDDTADEHLDGLLSALVDLEMKRKATREDRDEDDTSDDEVRVDFVTWRGMMTKIMATPYSNFDGFEMNATLFDRTIYIEECHSAKILSRTKQDMQHPRPGMPDQELMSYWGYKFESLCLLPDTWDNTSREYLESRSQHVVSNYEQYVSVVQTGIGNIRLALGGEVDGIWDSLPGPSLKAASSKSPPPRPNYIELKTSAELSSQDHSSMVRFERKLLKFWIQSFLLGVPKIIVGFRTNDMAGRLLRVQEYATTSIPKMVREQGKKTWDSAVCINFAESFLLFLRETITSANTGNHESGVWKIRRKERSPVIEVFKVEDTGHGDILSGEWVSWRRSGDPLEAARQRALDRISVGETGTGT